MKRVLTAFLLILLIWSIGLPVSGGAAQNDVETLRSTMERRYDVTIEMGDEISHISSDRYDIRITEGGEMSLNRFYSLLMAMDDVLSAYPPGFFSHIRIPNYHDRLRFRLVDEVVRDGESVSGFQTVLQGHNDIVLPRNSAEANAIHRLIWRAVEFRIRHENGEKFIGWADLNPKDFVYLAKPSLIEAGHENDEPEDWFVREYSKVNPREDMAAVFEAIMTKDNAWWATRPHLQEKAQFLMEKIRPVFGDLFVRNRGSTLK